MRLEEFLATLGDGVRPAGRGEYQARCPGPLHVKGDRNPSLSVGTCDKSILLFCHSGCTASDITAALGLQLSDLYFDQRQRSGKHTFSSAEILSLLRNEALVLSVAASSLAAISPLAGDDLERVQQACERITRLTNGWAA